jgi:drug/metabolite transporter (DMT)-like permease
VTKSVTLVLLLSLLWGLNWPAVRVALQEIEPWTLRAGGLALAGLILVGFNLVRGQSLFVQRGHWWRIAIVGVFSVGAFNILVAFAQLSASTTRSAIVTFTMPIWATILAHFVLGEPLDRRRMTGLVLGTAGLTALGWPLIMAGELSWGLLLALLAGMSWATGTTLLKRFPIDASPLAITTWQVVVAAICMLVGMTMFEGWPSLQPLSEPVLVALVYHVIFAQALAYVLWFDIVTKIPAGVASLGILLVPGIGVLGATITLGERPTMPDYIGLVLIVAASSAVLLPSHYGTHAFSRTPERERPEPVRDMRP